MDDRTRLDALVGRLSALGGLDEHRFKRLSAELDRAEREPGRDGSGRLRVAMFDANAFDVAAFSSAGESRFRIDPIEVSLSAATVGAAEGYKAICVFVNDSCDAETVETLAAQGVELIALRCAGFNNVDLGACERAGISVVHVPAYSPHAVAEHAIALMLMLNRRLHIAYQRNRVGSFVLDGLTGFDMHGKSVGVVGTGQIGRVAAEILLGFGCRILAHDPYPDEALAARDGVEYADRERLLAESDIVTLHAPLLPSTKHWINEDAVASMKDGLMLINTSRGGLVETRALIDGLKSGRIGAAGLDVYEQESGVFFNDVSDKPLTDDLLARLMTFNNVVITSHQAFLTREALTNIAETTLASVAEYESGKRGDELTHAVRPARGA